jgi:hypothetical protein
LHKYPYGLWVAEWQSAAGCGTTLKYTSKIAAKNRTIPEDSGKLS